MSLFFAKIELLPTLGDTDLLMEIAKKYNVDVNLSNYEELIRDYGDKRDSLHCRIILQASYLRALPPKAIYDYIEYCADGRYLNILEFRVIAEKIFSYLGEDPNILDYKNSVFVVNKVGYGEISIYEDCIRNIVSKVLAYLTLDEVKRPLCEPIHSHISSLLNEYPGVCTEEGAELYLREKQYIRLPMIDFRNNGLGHKQIGISSLAHVIDLLNSIQVIANNPPWSLGLGGDFFY